jgi:acetolactate synthase-1/2/3 large subunit
LRSVAQTVIESLRDMGVRHVFGVPSGGFVDFMETLRTTEGIDFVLTAHEGAAGFMADVCGRLTDAPGVCFGTFGPGATNLATGVGSAQFDRSPLIALTDEMPAHLRGRVAQMGVDHQALMEPITKWTTRLTPDTVAETLERAYEVAMSGRPGAVHIGMPVDVTAGAAGGGSFTLRPAPMTDAADPACIEAAQAAIAVAQRPVLAAGLGAVHADLGADLQRFAEEQGLPVVLTPMAKGLLSESHPNYAGVVFHALSDRVAETHQQADLVVAVGYDPVEFNLENWMPRVDLVNVDVAPLDAAPDTYGGVVEVEGDIARNLRAIATMPPAAHDWSLGALRERTDAMLRELSPPADTLGPCGALDVLREHLPSNGIMTCDVGAHTHLIGQKWPTPALQTQLMTNGWSAMGFGLPAAIAAKLCRPETPVCAVVGDGGFLMTASEISTALREKLHVVTLLLTDNDLALIRIKQQRKDNTIFGTPVRQPGGTLGSDRVFGAPVLVASEADALGEQLERAFAMDGPVVVEALVDSTEYDDLVLKKDRAG